MSKLFPRLLCCTLLLVTFALSTAQPVVLSDDPEWEGLQSVPESLTPFTQETESLTGVSGEESERVNEDAAQILSDPRYARRVQEDESRDSWLAGPGQRMAERIADWLERQSRNTGNVTPPSIGFLQYLTPLMWGVIGLVVMGVLIWVVTRMRLNRAAKRVGGLLDEDEEELTADGWLSEAEAHARKGEYRRAIRNLYLASLMRCDEHQVANFRRWETNWEHLYRIQASPKSPRDFDFRAYTQRFDLVWYGNQLDGESDYLAFRTDYQRLLGLLTEKTQREPAGV